MKRLALLVAVTLVLGACATGPTLSEMRASIQPLPSNKARIYMYRTASAMGSGIQPSIMLNGQKVGDSVPGGVFFCDVAPGNYAVRVTTEVERGADIAAVAGETYYVRMDWGFGFIVYRVQMEVVPAARGEAESQTMSVLTNTSCPI